MKSVIRIGSTLLIFGLCLLSPKLILAAYPEKSVTFICPLAAGGSQDFVARSLTEAAKRYFPKPMVVVNRPGGAGTIGVAEVIHSKPDGYTIGISGSGGLVVQPHRTKLPYGPPEDYTPIIMMCYYPSSLAAGSTAPGKNIHEFITYAKANPGKVRIGVPGLGTLNHIPALELALKAGIDVKIVPLDSGPGILAALLGGHVEAGTMDPGFFLPHVLAGKLRVLGIFDDKRYPLLSDVPTFKENGYDINEGVYFLVIGPKGLSPQIVSILHDGFKKAVEDPVFTEPIKKRGFNILYMGPYELKNWLMDGYRRYGDLVEILKLKGN